MALQPYVPPGTGSSGAIVSYTGQQISAEEREKRIKDVCCAASSIADRIPDAS